MAGTDIALFFCPALDKLAVVVRDTPGVQCYAYPEKEDEMGVSSMQIDQTALNHRSIRRFKDEALTADQLQALENVAQASATSKFMQQFSLIHVTDPQLKQAIAEVTTYKYVAGSGELFIFVLDQARNVALVRESGESLHQLTNWDALLGGVFDVTIAAQNMLAAAEHSNLGGVYLGSILNDPQKMIDLLHLPRYTFPLLGLMIGIPAEKPELKPRLPHALVVGENTYPQSEPDELAAYDATVRDYYQHRSWGQRDVDYTESMVAHLKGILHHRDEIGAILRRQGFDLPQDN
ncbi:NADPH-dependent oxidoreductase [Lacticaseibacillus hulanensis]|uniref:NADPH-dependent oxidoreductase n=1 Tax=Lacticaseibacillus hulanensis TaxID=2493111 RepID=UPI0013E34DED|nr:NADPH-dependent oxidoreductase [Lacticaseibacillus hulanensis]